MLRLAYHFKPKINLYFTYGVEKMPFPSPI